MTATPRRILLGVTSDVSVALLTGFPGYLAAHGWDVHVVSSPGPRSTDLAAVPGVTVHTIEMRRDPAPWQDLRALLAWIRLLRAIRPDVVSVGTPKAGLLGGIAGVLTRVPSRVYVLRGLRYESLGGQRRRIFVALERLSVACAHRVIAVSDSLKGIALQDRLGAPKKFRVVGAGSSNGVNTGRFSTTPAERSAAKEARWPGEKAVPVIGFIGRIHPDKGLDLLADAVAILAKRQVPGRLLVVGGADDAVSDSLVSRLKSLPWKVELLGTLGDVAPALQMMDLLCLPTRREGFPNVVLEAAAAGIPTVATAATGITDAILDGVTGIICHDRHASSLADALETLLVDDTYRATLGNAACQRVQSDFSNEKIWSGLDEAYASTIREPRG